MILPSESAPIKTKEAEAGVKPEPSDPPPGYSPVDSQRAASTSAPRPLPELKPCNFVNLSRANDSVSGKWILQPSLRIPAALLPPLQPDETEETRKNVSLSSANGSVNAEIYILPSPVEPGQRNRVFISTKSKNGSVTTKLHDVVSTDASKTRLPLTIHSSSANGHIRVYIPRSFRGPMTVNRVNGSIRLSDEVQAVTTPFSDVNCIQRSFIGAFDPSEWEHEGGWTGDDLTIEAKNGSIDIYYIDEADSRMKPKSPGFFGRIFPF